MKPGWEPERMRTAMGKLTKMEMEPWRMAARKMENFTNLEMESRGGLFWFSGCRGM